MSGLKKILLRTSADVALAAAAIASLLPNAATAQIAAATPSPSNSNTAETQTPAVAGDQAPDTAMADIVVTANKRSQRLNDVGISITAATGDQLAQAGVRDTADLAKITPGLTFAKSQNGTPVYTLRGVGFNDYTLGASPAVSVYVDQVPLSLSVFTKGGILDLERVEVLKGPQGLLFGQNSTGGAINYIANKPTDHFEAGGSISFGRFNDFVGDGFISGPVTDTLGIRVAASTEQSSAWQQSVSRDAQLGKQNFFQGRFLADWKPSDRLSILLSASGWRDRGDSQAAQLVDLFVNINPAQSANPAEVQRRIDALRAAPRATGNARQADWTPGTDLKNDQTFYQISLRGDYELTDNITLTSVSAYSHYKEHTGLDRDGTTLQVTDVRMNGRVNSYYQELRLTGKVGPLDWLVGGNYAQNKVNSANDVILIDSTNTAILPGGPYIQGSTTTITQNVRDKALFANAEYKVSDTLTLLGGARYAESRTAFSSCLRGGIGIQSTLTSLAQRLSGVTEAPVDATTCMNLQAETFRIIRTPFADRQSENNVSWRGGLNWKPNSDTLIYGLVSRGYKSGSFPTIPASSTAQFAPVTQESLTDYEAGTKITLFDRKLQLNGAIFHYDYRNKQVRGIILDPIFNQLEQLVNIPRSRVNGAELEVTYRPVQGMTVHGGATYADSKILTFTGLNNNRVTANYRGAPLPFSPKWSLVADASYDWSVKNDMNAFVGTNAVYNDSTNSTLINGPESRPGISTIKSFATLDLRAGIRSTDDSWNVSIWGRNVTNTYYWSNQFVVNDVVVRYAARPATYGVTAKFNFR